MRIVTKYAMLALFSASFIALNNCGNPSASSSEQAIDPDQNDPATDYAILGVPPVAYPGLLNPGPVLIEVECYNGVDDDGDGLTDCMDPDCHVHPECAEFGPPLEEMENSRALTVYPNGILVPEDVVFLKARGADDDDTNGWLRTQFFPVSPKDCWIDPHLQNPYYGIPLGEALVAGPLGPIGPQLFPGQAFAYIGPRAGLIDECEFGTDLLFHDFDDDNGWDRGPDHDDDEV